LSWNVHYNATGRPEKDRHTLRLWFATTPIKAELKSATANQVNVYEGKELVGKNVKRENIPAYAENYRVASVFAIGFESELNSLWAHMHLRGKDMTFSVTYPDGREEILLSVPKYSFNWQVIYAMENPVKIPPGSVLRAVAHYDNSANNKFNPTPDQELPWGGQSWHEMYFPYFDLAVSKEVEKARAAAGVIDQDNGGLNQRRAPATR
jgi:copper type II ascorbate-dependent monooxygenase-like protein